MKIAEYKAACLLARELHKTYVFDAIARGINIRESLDWNAIMPYWRAHFIRRAIEYMQIRNRPMTYAEALAWLTENGYRQSPDDTDDFISFTDDPPGLEGYYYCKTEEDVIRLVTKLKAVIL